MSNGKQGFRSLDITGFTAPAEACNGGLPPKLEWVSLACMVIDDAYQRPITRQGKANIERIAAEFDWSAFSPAIVAEMADGMFCLIDGQHRCMAAKLAGLERVPCMIVRAARERQAKLFASVNSNVTRMTSQALFHAKAESGDTPERAVRAMAERAGVRILRYPVQQSQQRPGETMLCGALVKLVNKLGKFPVLTALRAIVEGLSSAAQDHRNRGLINNLMVPGIAHAVAARPGCTAEQWVACCARLDLAQINRLNSEGVGGGLTIRIAAVQKRMLGAFDRMGLEIARAPAGPQSDVVRNSRGVSLPRLKSLEVEP